MISSRGLMQKLIPLLVSANYFASDANDWRGKFFPQERLGASQQTVGFLLAWLLICMTGVVGNIANAAHVIGLLVGVIFGAWPRIVRRIKP